MNAESGTYALVLHCPHECCMDIGRLGEVRLTKGHYLYIGSAFGSGGVRARVMRHHRTKQVRHWHIDYLTAVMPLVEVWYTHDIERREHPWAAGMAGTDFVPCLKGFGSSDCDCYTHLFYTTTRPKVSMFREIIGQGVPGHDQIDVWTPN